MLVGSAAILITLFVSVIMITPASQYRDLPMMHRVETWQNRIKGFMEDKEAVPAAKYDIDKDAQIAHANIAIATSNVVGKMPGNSVQRDFLSQAFSDFRYPYAKSPSNSMVADLIPASSPSSTS